MDVTSMACRVDTPTLVIHRRGDKTAAFEEGRRTATLIPGARFVALNGENHIILATEPQWPRFITEIREFLAT